MTDPLHSRASNLLAELGLDARHGAVAMVERAFREERDALQRETHRRLVAAWDNCNANDRRFQLYHAVTALDEAASSLALPTTGEQRGEAPEHCGVCRFHQRDAAGDEFCGENGQRIWPDDPERPEWCPLEKSEQRGEDEQKGGA